MKRILDLTNCKSTEEMCEKVNKQIQKTEKNHNAINKALVETKNEFEEEAKSAKKARVNVLKRIINWFKKVF